MERIWIVKNKLENHVYIWIQAFENMQKSCVMGSDRYSLDLLYTISRFSVVFHAKICAFKNDQFAIMRMADGFLRMRMKTFPEMTNALLTNSKIK